MTRRTPDRGSEPLFDLPLDKGVTSPPEPTEMGTQPELPLDAGGSSASDSGQAPAADSGAGNGSEPPEAQDSGSSRSPFRRRLAAGSLDLTAHLLVLALAVAGSAWLGVPPNRLSVLPLALFAAGFSFIYHVLPLVFWGRTPGMAAEQLAARSLDGGPLAMGQAVRRWLGAVLNLALLGLPFLLLKERSLADRLSGSVVLA